MPRQTLFDPVLKKSAVISECGKYRYLLTRVWDESLPSAAFVMLNPSTADATRDDNTVRRCIDFAKAWHAGGIAVVNLFALRATDPRKIFDCYYGHNGMTPMSPVGDDNDRHIREVVKQCHPVVVAWGTKGVMLNRGERVMKLLADAGLVVHCLGFTKDGQPRHPLYVPKNQQLIPFRLKL
jgi:hypothetical protein